MSLNLSEPNIFYFAPPSRPGSNGNLIMRLDINNFFNDAFVVRPVNAYDIASWIKDTSGVQVSFKNFFHSVFPIE